MKTIKVYNIAKLIEKEIPDKRVFMLNKLAIVEGATGIIVFNDEAVGWKKNTVNATIEIGLTDIPKNNIMYAMPQYMIDVPIKDLMEAEHEEMTIIEFVDRYDYNSRLQSNFRGILRVIDEVGIDSSEYYKEV